MRQGKKDIHELLKLGENGENAPIHSSNSRPNGFLPFGISDQYMILDSFSKIQDLNIPAGNFKWNFKIQGDTDEFNIGVKDEINNITEIQMGSFSMPILENIPYIPTNTGLPNGVIVTIPYNNISASPLLNPNQYPQIAAIGGSLNSPNVISPWCSNPYSQTPFNNRITVQLKEIGLQSFSDRNNARHSFEYELITGYNGENPTMMKAVPAYNSEWNTYIMTEPIQQIHGLTLVFRNPDIPINFLPDLYRVSLISTLIDGRYLIGFTLPNNDTLNINDRIFITGFKSNIQNIDTYINRQQGHTVIDNNITPLSLSESGVSIIGTIFLNPLINITELVFTQAQPNYPNKPPIELPLGVLPSNVVNIYIAKRRLRIPIRFRRIINKLTNYIQP